MIWAPSVQMNKPEGSTLLRQGMFYLLLGLVTLPAVADEEFTSPVLERKISVTQLVDFAKSTLSDQISILRRTYRVKVLLLDGVNLPEDAEAVKFYGDAKRFPKLALRSGRDVMFLRPYDYEFTAEKKIAALEDRPYSDQPILMLRSTADHAAIVHEFVHFLLWQAKKPVPVKVGTRLLDPLTERMFALYGFAEDLVRLKKLETDATDEQRPLAVMNTSYSGLRYTNALMDVLTAMHGEEVDVNRIVLQYASRMRISIQAEKEVAEALASVLLSANDKSEDLLKWIADPNFQKAARNNARMKDLLEDTLRKTKAFDQRFADAGEWLLKWKPRKID